MYGFEPRDKSGPMDIDETDPMGRISQWALPDHEEGPARKRPHSDLTSPGRPFNLNGGEGSSRPPRFGADTPFMFNLSKSPQSGWAFGDNNQTQTKSFVYEPARWASTGLFAVGTTNGGTSTAAARSSQIMEDVEMKVQDSPAKAAAVAVSENAASSSNGENKDDSIDAGGARPIAQGAVSRVRKKRQKEWRKARVESDSDGEGEETSLARRNSRSRNAQGGPSKYEHTYNFNVPPPTLRHSEIPALLLGYLQFFVNAAVVVFVLYLAVQFVLTIRRDVKDRVQEASTEILQEIAECTKLYLTNRCDPGIRVPAMEAPCKAWEACMQRDPTIVGRTNVMAETFAGVINSFVDPISWKTMGFTLVTLSFLIILTNSALWNLRGKVSNYDHHPTPPPAYHPSIPHQPWNAGHTPIGMGMGINHGQYSQGQAYDPSTSGGTAQIGWQPEKKKGWLW